MSPQRSFRSRLLLGWIIWTLGLLALTHVAAVSGMHRSPNALVVALGLGLLVTGLSQLRGSLAQFKKLRAQLSAVREGATPQIKGSYPAEVQPLVNDLNDLLAHRERTVARAMAKAGDLAHGLKTPLAVLSHEAERADAAGHHQVAATIAEQVERMRRQVDYHLAQARAAASGSVPGARCSVAASLEGLSRALLQMYVDRGISMDIDVSPEHAFRGQREDLEEMLGNLLDNAFKWTRSRVAVTSSSAGTELTITIDDNGPGIAPSLRDAVLQRGIRADETAAGSGLGLAIVHDLAELYAGSVALDSSPFGGLRVRLQLPAA